MTLGYQDSTCEYGGYGGKVGEGGVSSVGCVYGGCGGKVGGGGGGRLYSVGFQGEFHEW
jgi:hypothetical protein